MFTEECAYAGGDEGERRHGEASVLIVEDERVARRALGCLLASSGYATQAAESAEEALDLLHRRPGAARVALVDLNLPGMNGVEFIRRLEQIDPSIQPVLMTAAGDEALAKALSERAVPYVRKPLDFLHLLTLINDSASDIRN